MASEDAKQSEFKQLGNECFKAGNFDKAIEFYTKSLETLGTAAALSNRAQAYLKTGKCALAYADANEAFYIDPVRPNIKALFRRSQALTDLGMNGPAHADLLQCLAIEPNNAQIQAAFEALSAKYTPKLHYSNEEHSAAKGLASEAARYMPTDPSRAIELLTQSFKTYPTAEALNLLAPCHLAVKRPDLAYLDACEALRRRPGDPDALIAKAVAMQKLGCSYYFPDKWPAMLELFKVEIKQLVRTSIHTLGTYETHTMIECTGARGSVIQPEVTLSVLPHFLKNHVRGRVEMVKFMEINHAPVDEDFLKTIELFGKEGLNANFVAFDYCVFEKDVFLKMMNEVISPKKLQFKRFRMPDGVTLNSLFDLPAVKNAPFFSLGYEDGSCRSHRIPSSGLLDTNLLLDYLHSSYRELTVPEYYLDGGFEAVYRDLYKQFKEETRHESPYSFTVLAESVQAAFREELVQLNDRTGDIFTRRVDEHKHAFGSVYAINVTRACMRRRQEKGIEVTAEYELYARHGITEFS
ncbi:protein unc-45 A-like [Aphelenchoides avenae]|nr:protein unc-45 A-like [Aphelenchus avenae]